MHKREADIGDAVAKSSPNHRASGTEFASRCRLQAKAGLLWAQWIGVGLRA